MQVAIYRDPDALSGRTLARMIVSLARGSDTPWICVGGAEGAEIPSALREDGITLPQKDLVQLIQEVKQFDWGDFYLLTTEQRSRGFAYSRQDYRSLIPRANCLVRAVDDTYVYVFSCWRSISELQNLGPWESVSEEDLGSFAYPD